MTTPRLIDAFIDRLLELAAGAEPAERESGICSDIFETVHLWRCDELLFGAFMRLNGHRYRPLDDINIPGDHWSGPRGKRRRKLCFDVAVQAMASVKGDYRGKYR